MPHTYKKYNQSYNQEDLSKAVDAVKNGMSQAKASRTYGITRSTLQNHLNKSTVRVVGRPTVLFPVEEQTILKTLSEVSKWGYPLSPTDVKLLVKGYLDQRGRIEPRFKNNLPGDEFIRSFMKRNSVALRSAGNIKRGRASVTNEDIQNYFDNLKDAINDLPASAIFNYDETINITDDPGEKKVLVPIGTRRVERVQEHSKMAISLMCCGSADGDFLPPFVVYKAQNCYENWTVGGPSGAKYDSSKSGWFDMRTFERWFTEIFIPHAQKIEGQKLLIGDNLASHFSPRVVELANEKQIYFTSLPPNSTHLSQPLDVAVFRPMKSVWRRILDNWRKESRRKGSIPKEHIPPLFKQLWEELQPGIKSNLKSGFRTTGLLPFNPQALLSKLPGDSDSTRHEADIGRELDQCLISLLRENRGQGGDFPKRKRGKKIAPGMQISVSDVNVNHSVPNTNTDDVNIPSTSGQISSSDSSNECSECSSSFFTYAGPDWIQCIYCLGWVCGICTEGSTDTQYCCPTCNDE